MRADLWGSRRTGPLVSAHQQKYRYFGQARVSSLETRSIMYVPITADSRLRSRAQRIVCSLPGVLVRHRSGVHEPLMLCLGSLGDLR